MPGWHREGGTVRLGVDSRAQVKHRTRPRVPHLCLWFLVSTSEIGAHCVASSVAVVTKPCVASTASQTWLQWRTGAATPESARCCVAATPASAGANGARSARHGGAMPLRCSGASVTHADLGRLFVQQVHQVSDAHCRRVDALYRYTRHGLLRQFATPPPHDHAAVGSSNHARPPSADSQQQGGARHSPGARDVHGGTW